MFVNILASIYYVTIIKEKGLSTWEGVMGGVHGRVTEKKLDRGKERKWCNSISIKKHFIKTHERKIGWEIILR